MRIQIVKTKRAHKIDAIVALATAVCAASSQGEAVMPGFFIVSGDLPTEGISKEERAQRIEERREQKARLIDKWLQGD